MDLSIPKLITCILSIFLIIDVTGQQVQATPKEILKFHAIEANYISLHEGDTLLDIGSSTGMVNGLYAVLYNNLHQVLTDIDKRALKKKFVERNFKFFHKQYKSRNKYSFELVLNGEDNIPLATASYDKILCRRSFHEFSNPAAMLAEMHRVLRDTGSLVIIEHLSVLPSEIDHGCNKPYLSAEAIIRVFAEAGFVMVSQNDEVMKYDKNRLLSVLTFKKTPANLETTGTF